MLPIQETQSFFDQVAESFQLETFTAWHFWTLLTVLFLVGEVLTAGFLLAAFVAGTVAAMCGVALDFGFQGQLWCFAGGTLVGLFLLRPLFLRKALDKGDATNVDALVGLSATVTETIPSNGIGRARVRNEEWRATCTASLKAGEQAQVVSVAGNTVTVEAPREHSASE